MRTTDTSFSPNQQILMERSTSLMQTLDYHLCAVIDLSFLKVKRPSVDSTVDVTSATVHRTKKHRIQRISLVLPLFIYRVT